MKGANDTTHDHKATEERTDDDYLYVPRELLVPTEELDVALQTLAEHGVEIRAVDESVAGLPVALIEITTADIPGLLECLERKRSDDSLSRLPISPNHGLVLASHARFVPVSVPRPVKEAGQLPTAERTGITVAILDTGAHAHDAFDGRVVIPSAAQEQPDATAYAGHGTFMAGIVLRRAPGAKVIALKIPDREKLRGRPEEAHTDDKAIAEAIVRHRRVLENVDVLCLAVGGYTHDGTGLPLTHAALASLGETGPIVVAAAGNDDTNKPFFPAAFKRVIAVGALDAGCNQQACYSNHGHWVDSFAPGTAITSTFFTKDNYQRPEVGPYDGGGAACEFHHDGGTWDYSGWAEWDGTSFAAPFVAGELAFHLGRGRSRADAIHRITGTLPG